MAPRPGPISTTVRLEMSPRAATMRWMACWSRRKFWPSLDFWGMGTSWIVDGGWAVEFLQGVEIATHPQGI